MFTAPPHTPAPDLPAVCLPPPAVSSDHVLCIAGLSIALPIGENVVHVVDDVSLNIPRGKVVALVGESGCGKSLTALSILRLLPPPAQITSGTILFHQSRADDQKRGQAVPSPFAMGGLKGVDSSASESNEFVDLLRLKPRALRTIRGNGAAMIFQEPMTSLNPVLSIGEQISEAILLHRRISQREAFDRTLELLKKVEIPDAARRARNYPHQFSGGMRQRVMIAMAIANNPDLLIADEPTTALDVTTQRQVLDLLTGLQREIGMSMLLITHDLGIVAERADVVYVMYAGRIVEHAPAAELLSNPLHPYTQGLLECTPRLGRAEPRLPTIPGVVPEPARYPTGCRFHPRCQLAQSRAGLQRVSLTLRTGEQVLRRCVESSGHEPSGTPPLQAQSPEHYVACWEA